MTAYLTYSRYLVKLRYCAPHIGADFTPYPSTCALIKSMACRFPRVFDILI